MATTNKVKGWTGVLMTEDSSSHWPTKRIHVYFETSRQPVLSSFVFLDTTASSVIMMETRPVPKLDPLATLQGQLLLHDRSSSRPLSRLTSAWQSVIVFGRHVTLKIPVCQF